MPEPASTPAPAPAPAPAPVPAPPFGGAVGVPVARVLGSSADLARREEEQMALERRAVAHSRLQLLVGGAIGVSAVEIPVVLYGFVTGILLCRAPDPALNVIPLPAYLHCAVLCAQLCGSSVAGTSGEPAVLVVAAAFGLVVQLPLLVADPLLPTASAALREHGPLQMARTMLLLLALARAGLTAAALVASGYVERCRQPVAAMVHASAVCFVWSSALTATAVFARPIAGATTRFVAQLDAVLVSSHAYGGTSPRLHYLAASERALLESTTTFVLNGPPAPGLALSVLLGGLLGGAAVSWLLGVPGGDERRELRM